jgi:hypothetical protein
MTWPEVKDLKKSIKNGNYSGGGRGAVDPPPELSFANIKFGKILRCFQIIHKLAEKISPERVDKLNT